MGCLMITAYKQVDAKELLCSNIIAVTQFLNYRSKSRSMNRSVTTKLLRRNHIKYNNNSSFPVVRRYKRAPAFLML